MFLKFKVFFASLLFLLTVSTINALVADDPEEQMVTVVRQKERFRKRVLFIYDCSGSMSRSKLEKAFTVFSMIAQQPIDEMEIALIAFDDKQERWPGIPEPRAAKPIPKGWAAMPSLIAFKKARKWLNGLGMKNSSTDILPPLAKAFEEKRQEISIVIVSDGAFNDNCLNDVDDTDDDYAIKFLENYLKKLQEKRKQVKLDLIQVNCFGIGRIDDDTMRNSYLKILAEIGGGFYIKYRVIKGDLED